MECKIVCINSCVNKIFSDKKSTIWRKIAPEDQYTSSNVFMWSLGDINIQQIPSK